MQIVGGTPDYISPELLQAIQGDLTIEYGAATDWWSLGIVMYEMLYGETPFSDDSVLVIYRRILEHPVW